MTETYPLDVDGVWCEVSPGCCRGAPALFLDRDGVVVEEVDYLHRVADIHICPDAGAVISAANANAIPVVLVTGVPREALPEDASLALSVMRKPFDVPKLAQLVRGFSEKRAARS